MRLRIRKRNLAAMLLATVAGCAGPTRFIHPQADMPYYESVAIVPFNTLSQDRLAGEKVTNVFFTELLQIGFAEVLEPGQFVSASTRIRGGAPTSKPWSKADLARLGEDAGVQGVFLGIVRDYEMTRVGRESFPLVSIEVRFVDAATGRVVWSASQTRRGGPAMPLFGWGEIHTLGELTSAVCRTLLRTLPRG